MTKLTASMHSFCVGRFILDVPAQAKLPHLFQRIHGMGGVEISGGIARTAYDLRAKEKEAELRAKPHQKEGSVLHEVWRPEGVDGTLFVHRDSDYAIGHFAILAYFWRDGRMFTFHYGASNDGIQESKDELMRAFSSIESRANDEIPKAAGSCIESAFLPGSGFRSESVSADFDFPDYPNLKVFLLTNVTDSPDDEGLLARTARHTPAFEKSYPTAKVETLRRAKRTVNGAAGEELFEVLKEDKNDPYTKPNGDRYRAHWEFVGVANSMEKPELEIRLNYDDKPGSKRLTAEELLALWDAVVNSLRPRPGAF